MNNRIISSKILTCLAKRHRDDIFLNEVGNGPTGIGYRRMDAVAMKKSWANPAITVYEIKTSRGDFLADNKWTDYLKYCNLFSFAVAENVCDKSELPPEAGLILYNAEKDSIKTIRRPLWRPIDTPVGLYEVMLMRLSRNSGDYGRVMRVGSSWYRQKIEDYVADKEYRQKLSRDFKSKIARERDDALRRAEDAEYKAKEAANAVHALEAIRKDLYRAGCYTYGDYSSVTMNVHNLIFKNHPDAIENNLQKAANEINAALESIRSNKPNISEPRGTTDAKNS